VDRMICLYTSLYDRFEAFRDEPSSMGCTCPYINITVSMKTFIEINGLSDVHVINLRCYKLH